MSTEQRELGKNYIGILCEATEEPRLLELPKSDRLTRDYFLDLIAAVIRRPRREISPLRLENPLRVDNPASPG